MPCKTCSGAKTVVCPACAGLGVESDPDRSAGEPGSESGAEPAGKRESAPKVAVPDTPLGRTVKTGKRFGKMLALCELLGRGWIARSDAIAPALTDRSPTIRRFAAWLLAQEVRREPVVGDGRPLSESGISPALVEALIESLRPGSEIRGQAHWLLLEITGQRLELVPEVWSTWWARDRPIFEAHRRRAILREASEKRDEATPAAPAAPDGKGAGGERVDEGGSTVAREEHPADAAVPGLEGYGDWAEIGGRGGAPDVEVVFVIDVSGSMIKSLNTVRVAAKLFARTLHTIAPESRLGVVAYRDEVAGSLGLTSSSPKITAMIDGLQAARGGGYREGVGLALAYADTKAGWRGAHRAIVLFGDSMPENEQLQPTYRLGKSLGKRGVRLVAVTAGPVWWTDAKFFRNLAALAGGRSVRLHEAAGVTSLLAASLGADETAHLERIVRFVREESTAGR